MSVYINGMEMPIDCCDCPMSGDYRMCCSLMPGVPALYAEFTDAIKTNRRHKDCPLIPVPKHGDLIDKRGVDVLSWTEKDEGDFKDGVLFVLDKLDELPVIIPADPEEEGEG